MIGRDSGDCFLLLYKNLFAGDSGNLSILLYRTFLCLLGRVSGDYSVLLYYILFYIKPQCLGFAGDSHAAVAISLSFYIKSQFLCLLGIVTTTLSFIYERYVFTPNHMIGRNIDDC